LTTRGLGRPIKIVIISDLKNTPLLSKPLDNIESIVFENKIRRFLIYKK
jgi:hypothetical protein